MGESAAYERLTGPRVRFETPYHAERSSGTAICEEHVDLAIVVEARAPREAPRAGRPGTEGTRPLAREAVLARTDRCEPRILSDRRQAGAVKRDDIDRDARLEVRVRRPGDHLAGRRKKVQDLLVDAKVPRAERAGWPVVVRGDEVVAVPGVAAAPGWHGVVTARREP